MYDDILKFRKLCGILKAEKKYSNKKLYLELGVSDPTLARLLGEDINEMKPRASILALVQDFIKKHIEDLNYAGIESVSVPDQKKEQEVDRMRKNLSDYRPESKTDPDPDQLPGFDELSMALQGLKSVLPKGATVTICINAN